MAIELFVEDETETIKLEDTQKNEIADIVTNMFQTYNEARTEQLDMIDVIKGLVFEKYPAKIKYGQTFALPDVYKLYDTMLSHLTERVYYSNDAVFDVKGLDSNSAGFAEKQKISIVNDLDNMDFSKINERTLANFGICGEMISIITYEQKIKKRKVRRSQLQPIVQGSTDTKYTKIFEQLNKNFPNAIEMVLDGQIVEGFRTDTGDIITSENINKMTKTHCYYEVVSWKGVNIEPIKSEDFVFDVQKYEDFDTANKIYRTYQSLNDILNNKSYTLDDDTKEFFTEKLLNAQQTTSDLNSDDERTDTIANRDLIGNQVQIFSFMGDLVLSDGTMLTNYIADVSCGKILRLEPNPYLFNPYTYFVDLTHPEYRRGISRLNVSILMNAIKSNLVNMATDSAALIANPPTWTPEGSLITKIDKYEPGKNYEYDAREGAPPKPIHDFSSVLRLFDFVLFFDGQIDESSGISKNLVGAVNQSGKTATEIEYSQAGAGMRFSYLADKIKRGYNIPLINKIADLKAIHEQDDIEVMVTVAGKQKPVVIDNVTRQGNYRYTLIDSKTANDRKAKFKELIEFIGLFMNTPIPNMEKLFEEGLNMLHIEDPQAYINSDGFDSFLNQIMQQLNLPNEQKEEFKQMATQQATQFIQSQLQVPTQGDNNVINQ